MSAFKVSVRTRGASPGSTTAILARPSARLATCMAWPVPFCGCCNTVSAVRGWTTAATRSAWWPTTTTFSRAFSGSQARISCSTSVRPPARCSTFARLDFSRVPLPAARITMARSLLDMVLSPFCGSSGYFATEGCSERGESLISGRGGRKGSQVGVAFGAGDFAGGDGPKRGIGQEAADELGVQGMARFVGFDARQKGQARQREIANQIQRFVASKLVGEAQRSVHDAVIGEHDGVLQRAAANQAHGLERRNVALETESSGARQKVAKSVRPNQHLHFLLTYQGMRKIHVAAHAKLIGRIDADPAVSFGDLQGFPYLQIAPLAAQFANAGLLQHLHEGLCRAVQDGHFDRVDVDVNVVDATGINGGEQMLGGGEQNALFHEAGGITNASDVLPLGFNKEIVQVNAAKHDACFGRGRYQANVTVHAGVEAHTLCEGLIGDGSLEHFPLRMVACCSPTPCNLMLCYQ